MNTKLVSAIIAGAMILTAVSGCSEARTTNSISDDLSLAERYLSEMNYEQAIVEFDKILNIDPKNADAYLGKAEAYIALGDTDSAIKTLQTSCRQSDDDRLKARLDELLALVGGVAQSEPETEDVTSAEETTPDTPTTADASADDENDGETSGDSDEDTGEETTGSPDDVTDDNTDDTTSENAGSDYDDTLSENTADDRNEESGAGEDTPVPADDTSGDVPEDGTSGSDTYDEVGADTTEPAAVDTVEASAEQNAVTTEASSSSAVTSVPVTSAVTSVSVTTASSATTKAATSAVTTTKKTTGTTTAATTEAATSKEKKTTTEAPVQTPDDPKYKYKLVTVLQDTIVENGYTLKPLNLNGTGDLYMYFKGDTLPDKLGDIVFYRIDMEEFRKTGKIKPIKVTLDSKLKNAIPSPSYINGAQYFVERGDNGLKYYVVKFDPNTNKLIVEKTLDRLGSSNGGSFDLDGGYTCTYTTSDMSVTITVTDPNGRSVSKTFSYSGDMSDIEVTTDGKNIYVSCVSGGIAGGDYKREIMKLNTKLESEVIYTKKLEITVQGGDAWLAVTINMSDERTSVVTSDGDKYIISIGNRLIRYDRGADKETELYKGTDALNVTILSHNWIGVNSGNSSSAFINYSTGDKIDTTVYSGSFYASFYNIDDNISVVSGKKSALFNTSTGKVIDSYDSVTTLGNNVIGCRTGSKSVYYSSGMNKLDYDSMAHFDGSSVTLVSKGGDTFFVDAGFGQLSVSFSAKSVGRCGELYTATDGEQSYFVTYIVG